MKESKRKSTNIHTHPDKRKSTNIHTHPDTMAHGNINATGTHQNLSLTHTNI
jgi:hypothetical protein